MSDLYALSAATVLAGKFGISLIESAPPDLTISEEELTRGYTVGVMAFALSLARLHPEYAAALAMLPQTQNKDCDAAIEAFVREHPLKGAS